MKAYKYGTINGTSLALRVVMRFEKANRYVLAIAIGMVLFAFAAAGEVSGQCVDSPSGKTAVKLINQTTYELIFSIDEVAKEVVPAGKDGAEWEVVPGEHLLIASAIINAWLYSVWVDNEVPKGQLCTWTIEPPKEEPTNQRLK